jgi:cell wall-associated NlpC family hydrolase
MRVVIALLIAAAVTGCASKGGVATPRPFPGAALPPSGPPRGGDVTMPGDTAIASPAAAGVIATALTLRGTPYVNGGNDPSGFDCSGFVQWVFAQHGTGLPREVRDQYRAGRKVDEDELKPGDLVFFETVAKGASHVGIAIGNGEFVHAPSSQGVVRVEKFTAGYWAKRWVGARRIG